MVDLARAPAGHDHHGSVGGICRTVLLSSDGGCILPGTYRQRRALRHVAKPTRVYQTGFAAGGAELSDGASVTHWMNPHDKLIQTTSPFINYLFPLDMATALFVYSAIAIGISVGW